MMVSVWIKETESNEPTDTYFPNMLPFTFLLNRSRWEVSVSLLTASTRMPPTPLLHYGQRRRRWAWEEKKAEGGSAWLGRVQVWTGRNAHRPLWTTLEPCGTPPVPDGLHPVFTSTVVTTPPSVWWSALSVSDTGYNNGGRRRGEQDLFYSRVWKYLETI